MHGRCSNDHRPWGGGEKGVTSCLVAYMYACKPELFSTAGPSNGSTVELGGSRLDTLRITQAHDDVSFQYVCSQIN